ncbi:hypothetical protein [Microcoleus sp. bin38.metabat.b11b12b14.051]|uniref:hypothetical protein n=1 Tax=Microcoleus sp. bin38.metabat.b11b12b14.051 TaxID=2742709 RepID=UPI0025FD731B|nr:hypothetical protein [Microcoleus sp. bin38.metabat.b11b12b14.051]
MIQIKPQIQHQSNCPTSGTTLHPEKILWQGMHVCVEARSKDSGSNIIDVLRVGHSYNHSLQLDLKKAEVFSGNSYAKEWLGKPLLNSLQNPRTEQLEVTKEIFKQCDRVIILNCIDFLYGHSLLKLLNAQRHLDRHPEFGLVVIVPKFLRWMVPDGVAEVWTVPITLKNGRDYYLNFAAFVEEEMKRFEQVYVSEAYSHPSQFDITKFTRVPTHNFEEEERKITFIWREDRLYIDNLLFRVLRKLNLLSWGLAVQNWQVRRLFEGIRSRVPSAKFVVAGLGTKTQFPEWIEDCRVQGFNEKIEQEICELYASSRLVIGLHGSNMLLPSAHAGMTIDLIDERWGNFAQDIIYQESNPKMAAFRYRFLPYQTKADTLAFIAAVMVETFDEFKSHMTADIIN